MKFFVRATWFILLLALTGCKTAASGPTPTLPPFPALNPPPTHAPLVFTTPTLTGTALPVSHGVTPALASAQSTPTGTVWPTPRPLTSRTFSPSTLTPLAPGARLNALGEVLRLGKGTLLTFAFSADGRWLGLAVRRGIYLLEARTLNEVRFISTPLETPCLTFSPDGSQLAAADRDSRVTLYETATGRQVRRLDDGPLGPPLALSYYAGGSMLYVGTSNEVSVLWETATGKMPHRWYTTGNAAMSASADGYVLATANWNGTINLWTLADGHSSGRLWSNTEILALRLAPDGSTLLAGYGDSTAVIWQLDGGKVKYTLRGHSDRVVSVAVSPDGRLAATGSWDNTVCLWDMDTGTLLQTLSGHTGRILQLAFSADGSELATYAEDGRFQLWSVASGLAVDNLEDFALPGNSVFSADGETLYTGAQDGWLRVWTAQGALQQERLANPAGISALALSPDGQWLATGGTDGPIRLWETANLRLAAEYDGAAAQGWVTSLVFSPNGRWLAAAGAGETVRLWDMQTGRSQAEIATGEDSLLRLAFAPDSRSLAAGSLDGNVTLWQIGENQPPRVLREKGSFASALAFSPDGQSLAYGGDEQVISLWRLSGSSLVLTPASKQPGGLAALAFTPDSQMLAATFWDHTLRFYNPTSGALMRSFDLPFDARQLAISPDGRRLALTLADGTISIWGIR